MSRTTTGGIPIKEYNRVHKWAERHMIKKGKCFYCRTKGRTVWSNINHKYSQDKAEWQEVCSKCHSAYDTIHLGVEQSYGRPKTKPYNLPAGLTVEIRDFNIIYKDSLESVINRMQKYSWYKEE